MNHRHDLWTRDQEQRLLEICEHTHRAADIARELAPVRHGVSRNAIIGKIERMRRLGHRIVVGPPGGGYPEQNKRRKVRKVSLAFVPPENAPVSTLPKPRRGLPPPEPPQPELAVYTPRLRTLMELGPQHCRWPIGDEPPFLFCGAVREPGRPYCPGHVRLARGGHGR